MEIINKLLELLDLEKTQLTRLIDTSRSKEDRRYTLILEDLGMVVKLTNNSFTNKERIEGYSKLIDKYIGLGIYSPRIIRFPDGELVRNMDFKGEDYIIYQEELMKYKTAEGFKPNMDRESYREDTLRLIGKVASSQDVKVAWRSPYVLYERFSRDDDFDENYELALDIFSKLMERIPEERDRILQIINRYFGLRMDLREDYESLPEANFQADLNSSNILLDQRGNFVGLIDYNISGMEKILNYSLAESIYSLDLKELKSGLVKEENIRKRDSYLRENLKIIGSNYDFKENEKEVFNRLYNLTIAFRWPNYQLYTYVFDKEMKDYYGDVLDYIYLEVMREDICLEI